MNMVILKCWPNSLFIKNQEHRGNLENVKRTPSPDCNCSCHRTYNLSANNDRSIIIGANYSLTNSSDFEDSNPIYSTVDQKDTKKKHKATFSQAKFGTFIDASSRRLGLNLASIYVNRSISRSQSASSSAAYFQPTRFNEFTNILCLIQVDPFKIAIMDLLPINSRLIIFSLVDSFTKLSPNKFFEIYLKKLQEGTGKNLSLKVFNLSEPIRYLNENLNIPICEYGWPEKHVPSLEKLCSLCKALDSWIGTASNQNIAIIYSKLDLSRASLAIAVFLQYIKICFGEDSSIMNYESMETYFHFNFEKFLLPSQKRYIEYFKNLLSGKYKINDQQLFLNQVIIHKIPNFDGNGLCKPFIKIYQGLNLVYSSPILSFSRDFMKSNDYIAFSIDPPLKLRGEILIKCYHKIFNPNSRIAMFCLQFHTGTLPNSSIVFNKNEIDLAICDKRFHDSTQVELVFNNSKNVKAQNFEVISDDLITKCNSYENFFTQEHGLEYTMGPLDGSLYATVPKKSFDKNLSSKQSSQNEIILDKLLSGLFQEIESFPSISSSNQNKVQENGFAYDKLDQLSSDLPCESHSSENPHLDHDFIQMSWLQKQQHKLRNKQNKSIEKKDFIEKHLIKELKVMIENKNLKPSNGIQVPEIPIRTSSLNIVPEFEEEFDKIDLLNVDSKDSLHSKIQDQNYNRNCLEPNTQTSLTNNFLRATTPLFPVTEKKLKKNIEMETDIHNNSVPMFIKDTSSLWYKPNISREEAINYLLDKPVGTFIIRDSNSFPNSYGIAIKVISDVTKSKSEQIRHFLIESTIKGVQIKGCIEEPVFSSLAALVYQHSVTRISLPITLLIPSSDMENEDEVQLKRFYENGAACNVLYFTTKEIESLTGPLAISRVIDEIFEKSNIRPIVIHFKASIKGITLTDNNHRLFFRQHFPLKTISYCSIDPSNRSWLHQGKNEEKSIESNFFGFVARKTNSPSENTCLIFGQFEQDQPSHAIVDFINKLINL